MAFALPLVNFGFYLYGHLHLANLCSSFIGIQSLTRVQTSHPLDPLSAAEIKVAVATVRAAGATPEVFIGL